MHETYSIIKKHVWQELLINFQDKDSLALLSSAYEQLAQTFTCATDQLSQISMLKRFEFL